MENNPESTFGFELLYKLYGERLDKKEDVLILFAHWHFIKNGFKCLGIGDSKVIGPTEIGSELLPDEWNRTTNYTLRYVKEGKLCILMGIKSDADLLLNLLKIEDQKVSNIQFPIDSVSDLKGPLESIIPNYKTILNKLKQDLVEPLFSSNGRDTSTQTTQSENVARDNDPLRVHPPERPVNPNMPGIPNRGPLNIGRDDLDPFGGGFGGGMGGMLFDPFGNRRPNPNNPGLGIPGGRLPLGAVPPGARFDPFGPPDTNPRIRRPDMDHPPSNDYDDMFM